MRDFFGKSEVYFVSLRSRINAEVFETQHRVTVNRCFDLVGSGDFFKGQLHGPGFDSRAGDDVDSVAYGMYAWDVRPWRDYAERRRSRATALNISAQSALRKELSERDLIALDGRRSRR